MVKKRKGVIGDGCERKTIGEVAIGEFIKINRGVERIGIVTVPEESGTEQSYRLEVGKAWIGSRRVEVILNDFGITIAETRGACVIAIFWTGQKWAKEQDGPRES
jgi:hypothetical protein